MLFFGDKYCLLFLIPMMVMIRLWIKTPVFVSAYGKKVLMWLKITILCLLILAMLDPRYQTKMIPEKSKVVFALDISPSIRLESLEKAFKNVASVCRNLPKNVESQVIFFDNKANFIPSQDIAKSISGKDFENWISSFRNGTDTDIGEALVESVKQIPPGVPGRVFFFSDGRDTCYGSGKGIEKIADSGVPITTIPLETLTSPTTPMVIRCVLPESVFLGEEIKVPILFFDQAGGEVELEFNGTDGTSQVGKIKTKPGFNSHVFTVKAAKAGTVGFTVRVSAEATGNSAFGYAVTSVKNLPRVLVFENDPEEGKFLRNLLAAEKIDFVNACPGSWPRDLSEEIKLYPCVILNNIPKSAFTKSEMTAIKNAVADGMGLMMLGGPNSF